MAALVLFAPRAALSQDDDSTPAPRHHKHHAQNDASPKPKSSASPTKKKHAASSPTPGDDDTPKPKSSPKKSDDSDEKSAASPSASVTPHAAENVSLDPSQLVEFEKQPERVRGVIVSALALTKQNLAYTYGSDDPANGGMDCSGFIYHVLRENGVMDVPRDASGQYTWVRKADNFEAVLSRKKNSFELKDLHPGDLLFWTGTYSTEKDPPVTHTMIYLGTEKKQRPPRHGRLQRRAHV